MSYKFKVVSLEEYDGLNLVTFNGKVFLVRKGGSVQCGCCLWEEGAGAGFWEEDLEAAGKLEAGKKFIDALKRAGQSQPIRVSGIDGWHQLEWLGEDSMLIQPCAVNGKANQEYEEVTELNAVLKAFMGRRD